MTYKRGLAQLKSFIQSQEEICRSRKEQGEVSNMEQAVINDKNWTIMILKDILQELENDDLKLGVTFAGPKASDLPHLTREPFKADGITLESKGMILSASLESAQIESVVFWVNNSITIASGAVTIADFIYNKIKNYKNTKTRIGNSKISSSITSDELRKIIREELERIKKEDSDN